MSFFTIYICLTNASVRAGVWEFKSSRCSCLYSGGLRVRKRAGDDRVEGWMYSFIMLLTLRIIKVRHRVWNWIFKTAVYNPFSVACRVQKTR